MTWRTTFQERDLSGFISANSNQTGAMVVKSSKGPKIPVKMRGEEDVILYFGKPSATYFGVFEAIEFSKVAPLWLVSAYKSDARHGGVDVYTNEVLPFGARAGRDPETFDYATAELEGTQFNAGTGTGTTSAYSGTLADTPVKVTSILIKVGGTAVDASDTAGVISGDDIDSYMLTNLVNYTTGVLNFNFVGTPGAVASVTTTVNFSSPIDFSVGLPKAIKITADGTVFDNINLGSSATTTRASVISAINTALGYTAASVSGNFIQIVGQIADATAGNITVAAPTDTVTYASALTLAFAASTLTDAGNNPTGSIPKYGQSVTVDYIYTDDISADVSHSFYTFSPYSPDDLAINIIKKVGSGTEPDYIMNLYEIRSTGNALLNTFEYSLNTKKNAFGKSLYIFDVFKDNPRITPAINEDYDDLATPSAATIFAFTGGNRGSDPLTSDYTAAWNNFQKANRYPAKIFMDVLGNAPNTMIGVRNTYQPFAFCLGIVPIGNSSSAAITYRNSLSIDNDQMALATNWARIEDVYNNSSAYTSQVGKYGVKLAQMDDVFDALSPAGIDENKHGGQLAGARVLEMEYDYSDSELQDLDNAQLNPIIFDEIYGVMVYGDKTLQVTNSDTSFIGTRRLYNRILEAVIKQVLRRQEFKNNDRQHRLKAKTMVDDFLEPIIALELVREVFVQCDEKNNDDQVLEQRKFIIDIFVKIQPNAQTTTVRLTRLSQTQSISEFL